jgi:hypothetical protein
MTCYFPISNCGKCRRIRYLGTYYFPQVSHEIPAIGDSYPLSYILTVTNSISSNRDFRSGETYCGLIWEVGTNVSEEHIASLLILGRWHHLLKYKTTI